MRRPFLPLVVSAALSGCGGAHPDDPDETPSKTTAERHCSDGMGFEPDMSWLRDATALENPHVDIHFLVQDGRNFHDEHPASFELPDIARRSDDRVSTAEAVGNERELVRYYDQIVRAARAHRIPFADISHLFWLRLVIHDADGVERYDFAYLDTLDDIARFQEWVRRGDERSGFSDIDQGWAIDGWLEGGKVYLHQYDPDCVGDDVNHFVSRDRLAADLTRSVERARAIVGTLADAFGEDVWTTYRGHPWDEVDL